jgi:hypothetical protein
LHVAAHVVCATGELGTSSGTFLNFRVPTPLFPNYHRAGQEYKPGKRKSKGKFANRGKCPASNTTETPAERKTCRPVPWIVVAQEAGVQRDTASRALFSLSHVYQENSPVEPPPHAPPTFFYSQTDIEGKKRPAHRNLLFLCRFTFVRLWHRIRDGRDQVHPF